MEKAKIPFKKPIKTIDQQIDHLIQRGMTIPDREIATRHLEHINYYRLSGYWILFEQNTNTHRGTHRFQSGTNLEQVLHCYTFDRALRALVMDAIERIEVSMRRQLAFYLSINYGSHAHLDVNAFSDENSHHQLITPLKAQVQGSKDTFIKHFREKYSEQLPPIWATVEIMSFGKLSQCYKIIGQTKIRQRIADVYKLDEKILSNFLHHLSFVRNICAHHGNLWNRNLTFSMKLPKKKPSILYPFFNIHNPRKLYNTLVLIGYIMEIITNHDGWKKQIPKLLAKHPTIQIKNMGFPENWENLDFWK